MLPPPHSLEEEKSVPTASGRYPPLDKGADSVLTEKGGGGGTGVWAVVVVVVSW